VHIRNGQKLVNTTRDKIWDLQQNGQLKEGQYRFMTSLLSRYDRKELSFEDISIVALSLFADGLSTVCWLIHDSRVMINYKSSSHLYYVILPRRFAPIACRLSVIVFGILGC